MSKAHSPMHRQLKMAPSAKPKAERYSSMKSPRVMYHYGFSADMGGGEYDRTATLSTDDTIERVPIPHATIQDALNAAQSGGVAEIRDSGRYQETPTISVDPGKRIELRAANEHRPTLILSGKLDITGGDQSELTINGLLISGDGLRIANTPGNQLRKLRLHHCRLVPSSGPSLIVETADVQVEIDHCITGSLEIVETAHVTITSSIVDATDQTAVAYSG